MSLAHSPNVDMSCGKIQDLISRLGKARAMSIMFENRGLSDSANSYLDEAKKLENRIDAVLNKLERFAMKKETGRVHDIVLQQVNNFRSEVERM